jgi:hypothetical protein
MAALPLLNDDPEDDEEALSLMGSKSTGTLAVANFKIEGEFCSSSFPQQPKMAHLRLSS